MKILGVGNDKYICEIEITEMMTVMGIENMYDVEEMLQAGTEVDLDRIERSVRWIKQLDHKHLDRIISELKTVTNKVESVKSTAEKLNLFSKLSEDQYDKV